MTLAMNVKVIERTRLSPQTGLVSFIATYPDIIHKEVMTHGLFAKNSASSRAVPVERLIERCTFVPNHWRKNAKGMSGGDYLEPEVVAEVAQRWKDDTAHAIESARFYASRNVLKGLANRPMNPYMWTETLVTARIEAMPHFLDLRNHPAAEDHFHELAALIKAEIQKTPERLDRYHVPFVSMQERLEHVNRYEWYLVSACRARRVSYFKLGTDGEHPDWQDDLEKGEEMADSRPMHASPFEHQAFLVHEDSAEKARPGRLALPEEESPDFTQFRKTLPNEYHAASTQDLLELNCSI